MLGYVMRLDNVGTSWDILCQFRPNKFSLGQVR